MTDFSPAHTAILESVPTDAGSRVVEETVSYDHDGYALEGYFAHDESIETPKPTVLVIHDWTGLREYPKARAQMLARLGYAAFAIDMYGVGIRPTGDDAATEAGKYYQDQELMRSRVRAAFDWASADPRVDSARIAVIGYCFGGSSALEFARTDAPIAGVATFHGALISHQPADVSHLDAPILILTGGADDVVPDSAVTALQDELRTRDDIDWQVITYSGAPHAFTLPEIPMYRPVADARSWRELEAFLTEIFV